MGKIEEVSIALTEDLAEIAGGSEIVRCVRGARDL
jgi:hypothetical protein